MNGGWGIPATFEAEAACWLEGLAGGTQQQPRGKEASSWNACSPATDLARRMAES